MILKQGFNASKHNFPMRGVERACYQKMGGVFDTVFAKALIRKGISKLVTFFVVT